MARLIAIAIASSLLFLGVAVSAVSAAQGVSAEAADLQAARALFEKNIRAIQERNRDDYLSCYRASERLARGGATGITTGFDDLATNTPHNGSDRWPQALIARDLQLAWLGSGLVYGTYRYRVIVDGAATDGLSERVFAKDSDGWRIALSTAFASPPGVNAASIALVGATLYDGRGGEPILNATIVVTDGKIAAAGPSSKVVVPDGIEVVDLSGQFVTPGLIDTHVHYSQTGWADGRPDALDAREQYPYPKSMADCREHPERFHRAFLACGVTAVFDVGGYPWTRGLRAATEESPDAPHVSATGALLSTRVPAALTLPDQSQFVLMDTEATVRAAVQSHAAQGSDAIKVWFVLTDPAKFEEQARLVKVAGEAAKEVGLPLVVHATNLEAARAAVRAGAHLLVHSVQDRPVDAEFVEACVASGVHYCPTLTVADGYRHLGARKLTAELRRQLAFVDASVRARALATETWPGDRRMSPAYQERAGARAAQRLRVMSENLMTMHRAGVPVVLGTDAGNPLTLHGPSVFPELETMQAAGLTPGEVLVAATRHAARAMGRGEDLGVIAKGRIADLVVVSSDPGADIANMRRITHIMRAGVLQERSHMLPRVAAERF